ncbi:MULTISPECIES: thiamine pyrophosphate-dependent enzyme [Sphingobacterium]|jgi:pyruvate dehydrogenase (quinone)|uniref:thiamine pyrophosphate-dependent enzyme n=1 Tax=Sphingobacterium TaxID=28453 RepID=UPI002954FD90|nr:thiamine pyrophosphate-dependent enzyme [Sphingobacterium sp. UGAL515B_05]WON94430.1 thiamine pyrophosphate-dependent enzyme [Sphingobacterium sp. UGAL515B_05]
MKNVAHQIVGLLKDAGIQRIYAVTGDSLNFFNEAVHADGTMQWIHVRHEEVGAFAATAEADLHGIACCAGSSGPGHVHLINGVYEAHKTRVPMLVIASTCATYEFGTDYFQETNPIKLFDDCSCYNQMITRPEQVQRMVQNALQQAISKRDVAVIGLPGDVSEMEAVQMNTSTKVFFTEPQVRPSDMEIGRLAQYINQAEKVTLFCGVGAKKAQEQIVALSQKIHAPVGYSFKAKLDIQRDNPNEIGMTGLLGMASAFQSMHHSDLILLLGTDFPYKDFIPTNKTIVQIDIEGEKLGRRSIVDYGLVGDIKHTLKAVLPFVEARSDTKFLEKQLASYAKVKEDLMTYVDDSGSECAIQPEFVAHTIDQKASEDAIFLLDTGMCCVWGARYINQRKDRIMLGSFNHGSMANAMPMAIGAALTHPERQVIAFCGDGGLSMLLGDLATIKQYNLPIKIIVFNNRALGMVKLEMQVSGLKDQETNMVNPDFAMIAQAMGIRAFTVTQPQEVDAVITEALGMTDEPVLIDIYTNPNALAMPPKISFSQMKGMTESMAKLMLSGNFEEVWDTIKSNYKHLKSL